MDEDTEQTLPKDADPQQAVTAVEQSKAEGEDDDTAGDGDETCPKDHQKSNSSLATKKPTSNSIEAIRRKLSIAGLTDEATRPRLVPRPKFSRHRRSQSVSDVDFGAPFVDPIGAHTGGPEGEDQTVPPRKVAKLSCANLKAGVAVPGLEEMKKSLLREITTKLKEQIQNRNNECHTEEKGQSEEERKALESAKEPMTHANDQTEDSVTHEISQSQHTTTATATENNSTKRFSICSISSTERKRYSPVYERTRKFVRQSSTPSSNWSNSQSQVEQNGNGQKTDGSNGQEEALTRGETPTSPSASIKTEATAPVLSPVSSKGELEVAEADADTTAEPFLRKETAPASPVNAPTNTSLTRIGQYSTRPSEQEIGSSEGVGGSRSIEHSTSTLKRKASFKRLKQNLKKVGNKWWTNGGQMQQITLEKADKDPETKVPTIVVCCVESLRRKNLLKTEGLYRSSPSHLEVRKVIEHAHKGQYDYVEKVTDPVVLAGTLKSFFFNLKHHIITAEAMEKNFPKRFLMQTIGEKDYVERLTEMIADLDTVHYDALEFLIKHLQEVARYSKFNLMTPGNLGVVWAPCIFTNCDHTVSGADLLSVMGEQTRLLELLITHADVIFDRYQVDEIVIAIEPPELLRDGEPILNLCPVFESIRSTAADFERRKLMRNLSFDNVCEALATEPAAENGRVTRNYQLQSSATVPAMGYAQSDGAMTPLQRKMKKSRSKAACVVS